MSAASGVAKTVGFWRPRPPSLETLLSDAIGVAHGKAPVQSFAQSLGSILNIGLPWPGDFVDPAWDPAQRRAVIAYTKHDGFHSQQYMGYSSCRLCDKNNNGTADYTDGVWMWPEGYAHYLDAHSVRPPQEFIHHVANELVRWAEEQRRRAR